VDEMRLHREPLALHEMLTWMMEVKLFQRVFAVVHAERVAVRKAELDGVAVVDDGVGTLAPAEPERRLLGSHSAADVDGRLLAADRTRRVGGVEAGPFVRSAFSFIAPVVLGGPAGRCAEGTEDQTGHHLQRLTTMHELPPATPCSRRLLLAIGE